MKDVPDPSEWVDRYGETLYSFAFFRTSDEALAEEAVQETLLRGIRMLAKFEQRSSLKTWLTAILKNVLRELERRSGRHATEDWSEGMAEAALGLDELQALPPDKAVEREEFWEVVEGCLERLPVKTARIFWRKEVEGLSANEVGAEFGVSGNAVGVTLHRTRKFLRDCLTRTLKLGELFKR